MSETFAYIEDYFEGRLEDEGRRSFEARCVSDESFANDVAFYISQRQAIREQLLRQKIELWTEGATKDERHPASGLIARLPARRWILYGAAASALLAVVLVFTLRPSSPHRLAEQYFEQNYTRLSQTMNGSTDSHQLGITAYDRGDYDKALGIFKGIYNTHPDNKDALKFQGIVYLRIKDYDKALEVFGKLAQVQGLFSNPGMFLKAVTLLQRQGPGDREAARQLLQEVVDHQLEGSTEAAAWLKHF